MLSMKTSTVCFSALERCTSICLLSFVVLVASNRATFAQSSCCNHVYIWSCTTCRRGGKAAQLIDLSHTIWYCTIQWWVVGDNIGDRSRSNAPISCFRGRGCFVFPIQHYFVKKAVGNLKCWAALHILHDASESYRRCHIAGDLLVYGSPSGK